ncbi:MAG TPA: hypothetical protein VKR06_23810 [Ktedonosporobacter sp.]|nr:hypothetical protein [Ktedonosporobacter sp.]
MFSISLIIFSGLAGLLLAAGVAVNLYLRTHHALSPEPTRHISTAKQQSAQLDAMLFG